VDCKPLHLVQYAILGEAYSHFIMHVAQPRVGLLNVGEEEEEGDELSRQAHAMFRRLPIHFVGNVEGRGLYADAADVIVCDGFVGNTVLKSSEGLAKALFSMLRDELGKNPLRRAGAFLARDAFRELKRVMDDAEYGGAPLLGIDGICIIAHGSSSPWAIRNALRVAAEMVEQRVNEHIAGKLARIEWERVQEAEPSPDRS